MHQLTGLDAAFLYMEIPNAPMHVAGLSIYDQSTAEGGKVRFKEIIENFNNRVRPLPPMTRRLVTVPFDIDHPYWVSDGNFDPEFHVRHLALPKPGDWRQLCILISRLHAKPLDRRHPLWEAYVIEGLDNVEGVPKGSFAIFTKSHHAAIDGTSGMEMMAAMHDLTPDWRAHRKEETVVSDKEPGKLELIARAQVNNIRKPFHFMSVARNTVPGMAKAFIRRRRGELQQAKDVPRTRFNRKVSPHRIFNAVTFDLEEVKDIKNALPGTTVNDVAITICGGALRKYLQHHDELPTKSLAAMAPVNVRTEDDKSGGNVVANMTVLVRSDIEDPVERLKAVHEDTQGAKELNKAVGAKVMTDYGQFVPSTLTSQAARLASYWGLMNRIKPVYNCVITNVPGPQVPLYATGAKMIANYATGPVIDNLGLFHAITSYCGQFVISASACREIMPDPDFYRQCLEESFEELRDATAALGNQEPVVKKKAQKSAKKRKETTEMKPPHWALTFSETSRAFFDAVHCSWSLPLLWQLKRGDEHGVMVIPGFMTGDIYNRALIEYLRNMGYNADGWGQGYNLGPDHFDMGSLHTRLKELGRGRPVSVIGHSLGGIYAREIAVEIPSDIRQVISLGSPFADVNGDGTHAAHMYRFLNPDRPQKPRDPALDAAPPVPTTAIYTRGDGVIHWRTAIQTKGHQNTQNLEVPGSHSGLTHNAMVWYLLADRLSQSEENWRPHSSPLFNRVH